MSSHDYRTRLDVVPVTFRQASAFVVQLHRHHDAPRGTRFCLGVEDETGLLRGVAMVGRPVARAYDDGRTLEVNRTCTDGCPNANSALYGAAWRAAKALGYRRLVTYTQEASPAPACAAPAGASSASAPRAQAGQKRRPTSGCGQCATPSAKAVSSARCGR